MPLLRSDSVVEVGPGWRSSTCPSALLDEEGEEVSGCEDCPDFQLWAQENTRLETELERLERENPVDPSFMARPVDFDALTKRERDYVRCLERRRNWLAQRVAHYEGKSDSWDRHEHAAIDWALGVIAERYVGAA